MIYNQTLQISHVVLQVIDWHMSQLYKNQVD